MIIKYNSLTIKCLVVRVVVYRSRNVRLFELPRCSEIAIKTRQQSVFAPGSLLLYVILYTSENLHTPDFWSSAARRFPALSGSPMHYSDQSIHTSKKIFWSVCTFSLYSCACASYTIYALCTPYSCKLLLPPTCVRGTRGLPQPRYSCHRDDYTTEIIIIVEAARKIR